MRIFLTGMMGAGKTFWGNKIAEWHHIPFVDLDAYIEQQESRSITDIFVEEGEAYFRKQEHACLAEIIDKYEQLILACGGGTICLEANRRLMKNKGKIVYLKTDMITLVERLQKNKTSRPLLHFSQEVSLEDQLTALLQRRQVFYEQSDHIIEMNQIDERTFAELFFEQYV